MAKDASWRGIAYLYELSDPREPDHVRYVGITTKPDPIAYNLTRFKWWQNPSRTPKRHLTCWLRKLGNEQQEPLIAVYKLDDASWSELAQLERNTIKRRRAEGHDLCNHTDGGDGTLGTATERTAEWNARVSAGVKRSYLNDPELKARQAAARRKTMLERYGTMSPQQFIEKNVSGQKGKPWTEEQKAKARASHQARWARYRETGRDKEIGAAISAGMKTASSSQTASD